MSFTLNTKAIAEGAKAAMVRNFWEEFSIRALTPEGVITFIVLAKVAPAIGSTIHKAMQRRNLDTAVLESRLTAMEVTLKQIADRLPAIERSVAA